MRFMMLMIPKGYEKAAPGTMPDAKAVEAMMKYNESLQKAGVLLALEGLHPPSMGARVVVRRRKAEGHRRTVHRNERGARRLLDDPSEVEGRGDRMGVALPRVGERDDRDSSGTGVLGLPDDVQEAAAKFPEMQTPSRKHSQRDRCAGYAGDR